MTSIKYDPESADPRTNPFGIYLSDFSGMWGTLWFNSLEELLENLKSGSINDGIRPNKFSLYEVLKKITSWEDLIENEKEIEDVLLDGERGSEWQMITFIKWPEPLKSEKEFWAEMREDFLFQVNLEDFNHPEAEEKFIEYIRNSNN